MLLLPFIILGGSIGFASSLGLYYIIPLYPFVAIGAASLVWDAVPFVTRTIQGALASLLSSWGLRKARAGWWTSRLMAIAGSLSLFLIVVSPFLMSTLFTLAGVRRSMETGFDPVLVDANNGSQVIGYINRNTHPGDLVVASPALTWAILANAVGFQQSLASRGIATKHLPANIPAERFAFNPDYQGTRYVVIDRIWRNWAALNMPEVADMMDVVDSWPLEFSAGEIQVHHNPKIQ
jgi:hypothetical protein